MDDWIRAWEACLRRLDAAGVRVVYLDEWDLSLLWMFWRRERIDPHREARFRGIRLRTRQSREGHHHHAR